jgi:heterodisulfide reductase subunit A
VVIVQCINSSVTCSNFCCNVAKKYIDMIAGLNQEITISVLFENSRMPLDRTSVIPEDTRIHFVDTIDIEREGRLRRIVTDVGEFPADLIVLNMGMTPGEALSTFRTEVNFSVDNRGYIDPLSLPTGIWACGSVTGPKSYPDLEMEARSAALEALLFISKDSLEAGDKTVRIDTTKCGFCGLCVEACAHKAITLVTDNIKVDSFKCGGCGSCTAVCPTGALTAHSMQDEVKAAIEALATGKTSPRVLVLCCDSCGYPAVDDAGVHRLEYDPGAVVLGIPCAGFVDADYILSAIRSGFDGVVVVGCHENSCRYIDGIRSAKSRIDTLSSFYGDELKNRVRVISVSAVEGPAFVTKLNEFVRDLKRSVKA